MIRAAKIYHHFRSLLKIGRWTRSSIVSLVQRTDDELAQIAFELPSYLKFEYKPSARSQINEAEFPWLSWQRNNIALVQLHLRVSVNKILQNVWTDNVTFQRARSICLNSSTAIISLVLDSGIPREKLKSWAITTNLFSAAATLIIEAQLTGAANSDAVPDSVRRSCKFLGSIQAENHVSAIALSILETMCSTETQSETKA